jgi:hypothetical protein
MIFCVLSTTASYAGDVRIIEAAFHSSDGEVWTVDVTLKHDDTGWDHYADNWRVVDDQTCNGLYACSRNGP